MGEGVPAFLPKIDLVVSEGPGFVRRTFFMSEIQLLISALDSMLRPVYNSRMRVIIHLSE